MKEPALHNPEIHSLVFDILKNLKKGYILDIPSGPGYLLKKLKDLDFSGIAGEIDESLYYFKDLTYKKIDMSKTFPFEDKSFDYITSIEGIEHIENHFSFIRECGRVLKENGLLILSTPNTDSLESRFRFFFTGFHSLTSKPIPTSSNNIYFEHINPTSLKDLYFMLRKEGLKIVNLKTTNYRKGSKFLYYLFYPFIYIALYKVCFLNEKNKEQKKENKELFKLLISKNNLLGRHTVIIAKKEN
jgi:2-polyprenyl-3-methyl-5-hydroxy-6-metoxy-1,4-benzoquinol methylase